MIKQILDLLQISEFEGEHIDIAKGKYQIKGIKGTIKQAIKELKQIRNGGNKNY